MVPLPASHHVRMVALRDLPIRGCGWLDRYPAAALLIDASFAPLAACATPTQVPSSSQVTSVGDAEHAEVDRIGLPPNAAGGWIRAWQYQATQQDPTQSVHGTAEFRTPGTIEEAALTWRHQLQSAGYHPWKDAPAGAAGDVWVNDVFWVSFSCNHAPSDAGDPLAATDHAGLPGMSYCGFEVDKIGTAPGENSSL